MADIARLKEKIKETIYPNGKGAITAESHQELLLEISDILGENPIVFLTEAEYDALEVKDDNTLYYITEEE